MLPAIMRRGSHWSQEIEKKRRGCRPELEKPCYKSYLRCLPAAAATAAAEARSLFVIRVFPPVQQQQQQQHRAGQHTLIVQKSVEEKHEITYLVSRNQTKHAKLV